MIIFGYRHRKVFIRTISPVPLVHQLSLGVTKPHEAVLLLDTADVDQPAAVQLALHQRLVPSVGGVREQVLVTLLYLLQQSGQ